MNGDFTEHIERYMSNTTAIAKMSEGCTGACDCPTFGKGTSHLPAFSFRFCLIVLLSTLARSACKKDQEQLTAYLGASSMFVCVQDSLGPSLYLPVARPALQLSLTFLSQACQDAVQPAPSHSRARSCTWGARDLTCSRSNRYAGTAL